MGNLTKCWALASYVFGMSVCCSFAQTTVNTFPPLFEPKPQALDQTTVRKLHSDCMTTAMDHAATQRGFAACTELVQSGQLPIKDMARYYNQRASLSVRLGDFQSAILDTNAANDLLSNVGTNSKP
ncbi:hypothetical protein [Phyllobacterium sp. YR531]|uniref:hypothetical protein n=1 Tax=Phyllobacterium sp. YR531 TaxID=1144343 RepID=UPI00026F759E|nr:hypothetical protein [Phyllobacterium sp. YR531]EJN01635.1 hypothetical protein PMI41_03350 [Phyllobacterium sp. YR531]